jgi:hypothetical protein
MLRRILFGLMAVALATATSRADTTKGDITLKSLSTLGFGPKGVLFIGDSEAGVVYAVNTPADKVSTSKTLKLENVGQTFGDLMGVKAEDVVIKDLKVNPETSQVYVAVTRKSSPAAAAILKLTGDKFEEVKLKGVEYSKYTLPNASEKKRSDSITCMAYAEGTLYIAGLSNEEFASTLRSVTYPFVKDTTKGAQIEIYHAAHNALETRSPIQTFTPYTIGKTGYILASYTCTPLVRIPLTQLKDGQKIKGDTVAELGNMNRPLDIVTYTKDKKAYALMANDRRGVMKISIDGLETAGTLAQAVKGGGTAGVVFETIKELQGTKQLDKLNDTTAVVLVEDKDKKLNLSTVVLP